MLPFFNINKFAILYFLLNSIIEIYQIEFKNKVIKDQLAFTLVESACSLSYIFRKPPKKFLKTNITKRVELVNIKFRSAM
jgi:hypothetical protein